MSCYCPLLLWVTGYGFPYIKGFPIGILTCGLWYGGMIGLYFFKNVVGRAITVNRERYLDMLTEFFFPEIDEIDADDIYFQQERATCHTADGFIAR